MTIATLCPHPPAPLPLARALSLHAASLQGEGSGWGLARQALGPGADLLSVEMGL